MNAETLERIKKECEVVEQSGFGTVKIAIKNGIVYQVESTQSILFVDEERVRLPKMKAPREINLTKC